MRQNLKKMTWVLAVLALCGANGRAITMGSSTNRFGDIARRNVFGLKEPKQPEAPAQPQRQLPRLILNGISTMLGNKQVFMKLLPATGAPTEAGKEKPLMLTEGQRDGDVEVVQIDERVGSVQVINSGTPMTLTIEKDGAKLPSTPAPGTIPPAPGAQPAAAAGGVPAPAAAPAAAAAAQVPPTGTATAQPGSHVLPSRTPRLPATGAPTGAVPTAPSSTANVPTAQAAATAAPSTVPAQTDLTAEQQLLLQELQRQLAPTSPATPGTTAPLMPQ
jgi:hypothetical protein